MVIRVSLLGKLRTALALPAMASGDVPYQSPYDQTNHLWPIVAPDWFPPAGPLTRAQAMAIPAIKRGRLVICNSIARLPLRAYNGAELLAAQPTWIDKTNGPMSPYHRMVWTVDDLLFHGWSAWAVERGSDGAVLAADRIPFDMWSVDAAGRIVYKDPAGTETIVSSDSVILIPAADEGLLAASSTAVGHAGDLLRSASKAAENPAAYIDLHQTNDIPLEDKDRIRLIDGWVKARRGENGGVAFSSAGIEVRELGAPIEHLLVEGRNAAALDCARAMGIPGSVVDATTPTASMNYQNATDKANDLINYGLSAYMAPISARLGMDDVVPRGQRIAFDLEDFIGPGATAGTPDDGGDSTPATIPDAGASSNPPRSAPAPATNGKAIVV